MAGWFLDLLLERQMVSCRVRCRHVNNKLDAQWNILRTFIEHLKKVLVQSWLACPEPPLDFSRQTWPAVVSIWLYDIQISPSWRVLHHLLLLPPASDCVVSAHWDMLFGLIYNASPAPGHHVWQMTYFCADPHQALTWRDGWVWAQLCANQCMFVYQCMAFCCPCEDMKVVQWGGALYNIDVCIICVCVCVCFSFTDWTTGADASIPAPRVRFFCVPLPGWPWGVLRDLKSVAARIKCLRTWNWPITCNGCANVFQAIPNMTI